MNRGTVDLDTLGGPEDWWVARAIVQGSPEVRGKGIGSTLLNLALEKAVSMGATKVHVVPGGYGANPEDQQRFYEKNGFKKKRVRSAGFKTASYVWTWTKG
jgi:GNAT superfamily N-acetyltransferase